MTTKTESRLANIAGIIWCDVETTGLDPHAEELLEICCASPDAEGGVCDVSSGLNIVIRSLGPTKDTDSYVIRMHEANGLWAECADKTRALELAAAEDVLLEKFPLTDEQQNSRQLYVLAGDSVHFDLSFIRVHMPRFAARLSHRVLDVSAIRMACELAGMPPMQKLDPAHRAWDDICASTDKLRLCLEWIAEGRASHEAAHELLSRIDRIEDKLAKTARKTDNLHDQVYSQDNGR